MRWSVSKCSKFRKTCILAKTVGNNFLNLVISKTRIIEKASNNFTHSSIQQTMLCTENIERKIFRKYSIIHKKLEFLWISWICFECFSGDFNNPWIAYYDATDWTTDENTRALLKKQKVEKHEATNSYVQHCMPGKYLANKSWNCLYIRGWTIDWNLSKIFGFCAQFVQNHNIFLPNFSIFTNTRMKKHKLNTY